MNPCKNGHIGQASKKTGKCLECRRQWYNRARLEITAKRKREYKSQRGKMAGVCGPKRAAVKKALFAKYGGKCCGCGFSDIRALCIDHVHARPKYLGERKIGGVHLYAKLLREPVSADYQILCANCNLIKAIENRELGAAKGWFKPYRLREIAHA